jgi:hypothetical protein
MGMLIIGFLQPENKLFAWYPKQPPNHYRNREALMVPKITNELL